VYANDSRACSRRHPVLLGRRSHDPTEGRSRHKLSLSSLLLTRTNFVARQSKAPARVPTPNMDRVRSEGVTFTRAYCASPMCAPSRFGVLTGFPDHSVPAISQLAWVTRSSVCPHPQAQGAGLGDCTGRYASRSVYAQAATTSCVSSSRVTQVTVMNTKLDGAFDTGNNVQSALRAAGCAQRSAAGQTDRQRATGHVAYMMQNASPAGPHADICMSTFDAHTGHTRLSINTACNRLPPGCSMQRATDEV
jgi:hypothetical protein